MAYSAHSIQPRVVRWGGATIADNTHMTKASTAYSKGMLVRKTTTGTVEEVAANATTGIHGIILEDVASGASKYAPVMWPAADTILEAQVHHTTPASAVPAQALIGKQFRINVSSGIWAVDLEQASNPDVEIVDVHNNYMDYDAEGDGSGQFGLVRIKILASRLNTAPAAAS